MGVAAFRCGKRMFLEETSEKLITHDFVRAKVNGRTLSYRHRHDKYYKTTSARGSEI
jgi:hypothetical protein